MCLGMGLSLGKEFFISSQGFCELCISLHGKHHGMLCSGHPGGPPENGVGGLVEIGHQ